MDSVPGATGQLKSPAQLAALLRRAADEIDKPDGPGSFEGSIVWETPPSTTFDQRFEVLAFFRIGNDHGQGGAIVVNGAAHP